MIPSGMVETATYALAVGGVLFGAMAVAADVLMLPNVTWRPVTPALTGRAPGQHIVVRGHRGHRRQSCGLPG